MCGIVGYMGHQKAAPLLLKGLQRLEYRGYDSAGIALYKNQLVSLYKTQGKVADLAALANFKDANQTIGMGHTRWATHGVPSDANAHPHSSNSGELTLIHNGIIENYEALKKLLVGKGYVFHSDTDTEVLVNLIEEVQKSHQYQLGKAVQVALSQVVGAYAIVVFDTKKTDELVVAKLGSPLAIGMGDQEYFIASDASPFIEYTNKAVYLEDHQLAIIKCDRAPKILSLATNTFTDYYIQELELSLDAIEKGGYNHFMLKEIYEQPRAIKDTYRGRLLAEEGLIKMAGIEEHLDKFLNTKRIIIVACGTSWHAGLVAEYILEDLVRIPVEVEYASEFKYRNPIISNQDVVIAISQSGETADTLAAIKLAKEKGAFVFGVCNVVGSTISRVTDAGAYTHAGPEIGVASTKAFTTQITVFSLLALRIAKAKGSISLTQYKEIINELELIPQKVEIVLLANKRILEIAHTYKTKHNCLYLGRGPFIVT